MNSSKLKNILAILICLSVSGTAAAATCEFKVRFDNKDAKKGMKKSEKMIYALEAYIFPTEVAQNNFYDNYDVTGDMREANLTSFDYTSKRGAMAKEAFLASNERGSKSYITYLMPGRSKTYTVKETVNNTYQYPVTLRFSLTGWYNDSGLSSGYYTKAYTKKVFCNDDYKYTIDLSEITGN